MNEASEPVEVFLEKLRRVIAEDIEIAADLDAIRAGTFVPAPESEGGGV